jgi:hypothetical protein
MRETLFSQVYRACKEWKEWTGRGKFLERMGFVRQMIFLTIENGWEVGVRAWWQIGRDVLQS